jgi:hypothetical protein
VPGWESPSCAGHIGLSTSIGDRDSKQARRLARGNFGPSLSLDVSASVRLYCNVLAAIERTGLCTNEPTGRRGGTVYAAVSKTAPQYGVVGSNPTAGTS